MKLNEKLSPLSYCFRKKINTIFFKEYCKFYNIKDVGKLIGNLRLRGFTINGSVKKEVKAKFNPRKALLESLGVKSF